MIIFNDNLSHNKSQYKNKRSITIKRSVKRARRPKILKITKENKEFLRALGFKT